MPVVTDITQLSTTASSNYPTGTENANTVDDYIRQQSAFIAQLRDRAISVKDYGATGNGVTDDTAAITTADAIDGAKQVPEGTYVTTLAATDLDGPYFGRGQIQDVSTSKRAPFFSAIKAQPASFGDDDSVVTAFDGDLSRVQFAVEHRITGADTLTQPATGYEYVNEAYPHVTFLYNSSGWNESTTDNTGRTAACAYRTRVYQAGQGDAVAFNASAFVTGTRSGSTSFLANPAAVLFNGGAVAGAAGVYLNLYETNASDGGFDVACVGAVYNFTRTVSTGAKSAIWNGLRLQSKGTETCDALLTATGKWVTGIDFAMSGMDLGANAAAISLKSGQRIYLNNNALASGNLEADWRSTGFNGDYITHTTSGFTGINVVQSGSSRLQIGSTVTVATNFQISIAKVGDYSDDAAAATGGVPVGGVYRNGSALQIRTA